MGRAFTDPRLQDEEQAEAADTLQKILWTFIVGASVVSAAFFLLPEFTWTR